MEREGERKRQERGKEKVKRFREKKFREANRKTKIK
jgi:hypothetical protein